MLRLILLACTMFAASADAAAETNGPLKMPDANAPAAMNAAALADIRAGTAGGNLLAVTFPGSEPRLDYVQIERRIDPPDALAVHFGISAHSEVCGVANCSQMMFTLTARLIIQDDILHGSPIRHLQ